MQPEIVVGLLSLGGTLIGTFGGIMTSQKLTAYRIAELEKKVEKHNNLIDRMYSAVCDGFDSGTALYLLFQRPFQNRGGDEGVLFNGAERPPERVQGGSRCF